MKWTDDFPEEGKRLQFLISRDGLTSTLAWVQQTIPLYRKAVLYKLPPCANRDYRVKYIKAYLDLKRFKRKGYNSLVQLMTT